jgi:hypothetical protein
MAYFAINNPDWDGNEWICAPPSAMMHDATYDVVREPCLPLELRPPCLEGIRLTQENGMDDAAHMHRVMYCGLPNSVFFLEPLFPYILSDEYVFDEHGSVKKYELKNVAYNVSELDDKEGHFPYPVDIADDYDEIEFAFDTGEYGYDHVILPGKAFELSNELKGDSSLNLDTVKAVLSEDVMIPVLRVKEAFDPAKLRYNIHFVAPPVWGQFIPSWDVTVYYDNYQLPWWAYQVKLNATEDAKTADVVIKILGINEELPIEHVEIVPYETLVAKGKFSIPEVRCLPSRGKGTGKKYSIISIPRGIEAWVPDVVVSVRYNGKDYPLVCRIRDTKRQKNPPQDDNSSYVWPHVEYLVGMEDDTEHVYIAGTGADVPLVVLRELVIPDPEDPEEPVEPNPEN